MFVVLGASGNTGKVVAETLLSKIVATDVPYNNRLISVITIENRKIVHWRDYMDSLAPWLALNRAR
jgi:ketosteroid isomerase-like protein